MNYFSRVFPYVRPYWRQALCVAFLIGLSASTSLLEPWPLKFLVDNVLGSEPLPPLLKGVFGPDRRGGLLAVVALAGVGIALLGGLIDVLSKYLQVSMDQRMMLDFRGDLFQHAQRLSMAFHDRRRSGLLIYAINFQGAALTGLIMAVPALAQSFIILIGMTCIVMSVDPGLALCALSIVPFLFGSIRYYATHIQGRLYIARNMEAESLSIVHEAISMMKVIVAFAREGFELHRFRTQAKQAMEARIEVTVRQVLFSLAVAVTTACGTAGVIWYGGTKVIQGRVSVGQLLVVLAYIAAVYKPLESISYTIVGLQDHLVSLRLAFELYDLYPEVQERPHAKSVDRCRGAIAFEGVGFSYDGRVRTLTDLSFEVGAGESVAIVGPTGAGKTTLVSLIPRFYDVSQGRILLDGADVRDLTLRSLREQISLVLQEPLLFSGTVADNIRYGRLDANDEAVIEAARAANAHEFIMRLPQQYETEMGERGSQVSGGERQRICIARAFLKDAPILILDEPTSSIDAKTEAVILDALDRLMTGRTSVLIAHRLSTIRGAQRILVIDEGRLLEQGTHEELLARGDLYRNLYYLQFPSAGVATRVGASLGHVE